MKTISFFLLPGMIAIAGCNSQRGNSNQKVKKSNADTVSSVIMTYPKNDSIGDSSATVLRPHADTLVQRLRMNGINDKKIIIVSLASGKELIATLTKNSRKVNVRINQLEMPDSTFDGPFGDSLHYEIKMHGTYKIIIGADLMAEGNPPGAFTLKAWVK